MKKFYALLLLFIACFFIMSFNKDKDSLINETSSARLANQYMWNSFHQGHYDSISYILQKLNDAYTENPKDIRITAHLGFIYLWNFSERGRTDFDSSISQNIYLSNRFFKEAIKLNPDDPRLRGFQSITQICEGALQNNFGDIITGYMKGKKAVKDWPQFNKFALSLGESQRKKNSFLFRRGMKHQWQVINECSCKKLNKRIIFNSPETVLRDLITELENTNDKKIKRACGNTWIAPHNIEGFFLNLGDLLVKQGNIDEAIEVYKATKFCPSYDEWVFKSLIDERIKDVKANQIVFNKPMNLFFAKGEKQIFINSELSCVGCHQMSKKEFSVYGYHELTNDYYFIKN